eukprot:Skav219485  [mRNA]  locus=scaffold2719:222338:227019:+ [translate_table: standard]
MAPVDPGIPRITAEVLRKTCVENRGFELPELNEEYHNVRSIFLECNGIGKIENLEVMPQLVSLYLQSNCITRMENLDMLSNLQYLNLSHNNIAEVQNLGTLSMLETLNLAANKFEDVEKLKGLSERPTLRSVDVSSNYFEDGDALLSFWESNLPNVQALKDARRRLISSLPKLRWIDERPVTAIERAGCEAWAIGGKEAEMEAGNIGEGTNRREFHGNSSDASAALGKEFACEVSEQECRRRYGELCRPAAHGSRQEAARKSIQEGSGRAADGPPPDAAAVKEVSQWFVRRIRQGNGQPKQKPKVSKTEAPTEHPVVQDENPMDENPMDMRQPISSEAQSLFGSAVFAPPPRQPLDPIQLQNQEPSTELVKGTSPVQRSAVALAVSKCPEGLHDLD